MSAIHKVKQMGGDVPAPKSQLNSRCSMCRPIILSTSMPFSLCSVLVLPAGPAPVMFALPANDVCRDMTLEDWTICAARAVRVNDPLGPDASPVDDGGFCDSTRALKKSESSSKISCRSAIKWKLHTYAD